MVMKSCWAPTVRCFGLSYRTDAKRTPIQSSVRPST